MVSVYWYYAYFFRFLKRAFEVVVFENTQNPLLFIMNVRMAISP